MVLIYYYPLEVTVISADALRDVHWMSETKAYVEVSLNGSDSTMEHTRPDENGGVNPRWNEHFSFPIEARTINSLRLVFDIKSKGTFRTKNVGQVSVPLRELFDSNDAATEREVEYPVHRKPGKPEGNLRFSYRFGERAVVHVNTGEAGRAYARTGGSTLQRIGGVIMFVEVLASFLS